jgi:hypothetical protein
VDISVKLVLMMLVAPLIAGYFRGLLMTVDPIRAVLDKLPASTFESIITAIVISLIPFVESAFAIDSDKLSDKWAAFFAWLTELSWLPEDFDLDALAAVFAGIGIGGSIATRSNNDADRSKLIKRKGNNKYTKKRRSRQSEGEKIAEIGTIGSAYATITEAEDDNETTLTGFVTATGQDDVQESIRALRSREQLRSSEISL